MTKLNGYTVAGQTYYAGIWVQLKTAAPAYATRLDTTAPELQAEFNNLKSQGYSLRHMSAYAIGNNPGDDRFAAIFSK